jgi:hypothetical protein
MLENASISDCWDAYADEAIPAACMGAVRDLAHMSFSAGCRVMLIKTLEVIVENGSVGPDGCAQLKCLTEELDRIDATFAAEAEGA